MTDFNTILFESSLAIAVRQGRYLIVTLKKPHSVISTSSVNGGLSKQIQTLVNHQSCEASGHTKQFEKIQSQGQDAYHHSLCKDIGLDSLKTATMGTAANMQYVAIQTCTFEDLSVTSMVTAGVEGNAGTAGDPAGYIERNGEYEPLIQDGTINTILLFDHPLTDSALSRAIVTMTEAKSAALQELGVRSKISAKIATGTGTDQFCIASPNNPNQYATTWTGQHSKIGELIGQAVLLSTKEALRWQNGMEISNTRNLYHALSSFGISEQTLLETYKNQMRSEDFNLFKKNVKSVVYDPQVSANAYALAAIQERVQINSIPKHSGKEAILNQCALLSATLATKPSRFQPMRERLIPFQEGPFKSIVIEAIKIGFFEKWDD